MIRHIATISCAVFACRAAIVEADSTRGERLFTTLSCVQCHSIDGRGGRIGPDLGRMIDRNFTPAKLAATMWNHAPAMWQAMQGNKTTAGELDEQGAADLFAWFASVRFFEKEGDAARGKELFAQRGCASCHGLSIGIPGGPKPVTYWDGITDPLALAEQMWNHAPQMIEARRTRGVSWEPLSGQDLSDLLVYFRSLPDLRGKPGVLRIGAGNDGEVDFESQGCAKCHTSGPLSDRIRRWTLTDIATEMWNHAPRMEAAGAAPHRLEAGEMREIMSYLWARQFFEDAGDRRRGKRVFTVKHCAGCHERGVGGAPKLTGSGQSYSAAAMVSVLWRHGPNMLAEMQAQKVAWPRFEETEMSDLIAYLNSEERK